MEQRGEFRGGVRKGGGDNKMRHIIITVSNKARAPFGKAFTVLVYHGEFLSQPRTAHEKRWKENV
jgi:hypothetical protein